MHQTRSLTKLKFAIWNMKKNKNLTSVFNNPILIDKQRGWGIMQRFGLWPFLLLIVFGGLREGTGRLSGIVWRCRNQVKHKTTVDSGIQLANHKTHLSKQNKSYFTIIKENQVTITEMDEPRKNAWAGMADRLRRSSANLSWVESPTTAFTIDSLSHHHIPTRVSICDCE